MIKVEFAFDKAALKLKIDNIRTKGIKVMSAEALKDANYYAPMKSGKLWESGILHSTLTTGELEWDMPYARYMYFGIKMVGSPKKGSVHTLTGDKLNYSKAGHDKAQSMWAHKGYAENRDKYLGMLEKIAKLMW